MLRKANTLDQWSQLFWHQGQVLWKIIFPRTWLWWGGGQADSVSPTTHLLL